jgi:hypothetical protein
MMGKWQKQHSLLMLGKKSQMMTIDSLISYMIFAFFLFYMSKFIIDLMNPFSRSINNDIIYKSSEALSAEFYKSSISNQDFLNFCNYSKGDINSVRSYYEVKSILIPYYDSPINDSKKGIHFQRIGNKILLTFNTNSSEKLDLIVFSTNQVYFFNISNNEYNYFNKTQNNKQTLINIFSNTTQSPYSYELIVNDSAIIFFNIYNYTNMYFGKIPYSYSCGDFKVFEEKRKISSTADFENKKILINYDVEVWFE